VRHQVEVTCPANAIPDHFEFNLEGLEIGRSVHISATRLPEGVRPTITNRDFTVATIAGHKIEEEPTPGAEVTTAEGAAPAKAAEGAPAAAEGAAASPGKAAPPKAAPGKETAAKPAAGATPALGAKPAAEKGKKQSPRRDRPGPGSRAMKHFGGLGNPGTDYARPR